MAVFFSRGSRTAELTSEDLSDAIEAILTEYPTSKRVLAIPPDHTRYDSRGGELTCLSYQKLRDKLHDILPALGTHAPMEREELEHMFPGVPLELFRPHRWRTDVQTLGEVPAEFVEDVTEGIYQRPWPAQVNRLLTEGGHDLILSFGQVVPHEVIGMANYNKNIFVGTGGSSGINESHYLSALYGMERIMGRCRTPLRRILNEASDRFCQSMPIVYVLTVIESLLDGRKILRGVFAGTGHDLFWQAGRLAAEVNCTRLEKAPKTVVVLMNPAKYKRTWLANKAIYRTRMAVADAGRLIVIAPGVSEYGEDPEINRLIARYGYRTTPEVLDAVAKNEELRLNLSAAAHLIHGSPENRFEVVYCPGTLSKEATESVGYSYGDHREMTQRYRITELDDGWHQTDDREEFYFIRDPGLGLWMHSDPPSAGLEEI